MKKFGTSNEILLYVYNKFVRSNLEYAVPAWNPGLTKQNSIDIERVQKCAMSIISGGKPYRNTLKKTKVKTLEARRKEICSKFATKARKNIKFQNWFKQNDTPTRILRRPRLKYKHVNCRTKRYERSPIPYMTKLLNTE